MSIKGDDSVSLSEHNEINFYTYAMKLLFAAGHVSTLEPEFANHSPERFVYFDNKGAVSLSQTQRAMFKTFNYISYLFSSHDCAFFSISLLATREDRSQIAYDIHTMIHPIIDSVGTICLFQFDDEVMLSFIGYGSHCILSDWYPMDDDNELLADALSIANISINDGFDYFSDLVYVLSRQYYLTSQPMIYELLPIGFISDSESNEVNKEELNQFIEHELSAPQREYGDDYVDYDDLPKPQSTDINADLDLMLLEMDDECDNPFNEEMESGEEEDEIPEQDEYEFDNVNPEIFRDPTLLVKWLNQMENNSQHKTAITTKPASL